MRLNSQSTGKNVLLMGLNFCERLRAQLQKLYTSITLKIDNGFIKLAVRDNGIGFDVAQTSKGNGFADFRNGGVASVKHNCLFGATRVSHNSRVNQIIIYKKNEIFNRYFKRQSST